MRQAACHSLLNRGKEELAVIPAKSITEVSYGQDVHRRVGAAIGLAVISLGVGALMALTKSKKHFVSLTWMDGDKKGGLPILFHPSFCLSHRSF